MELLQSIILGIVQGLTEFLPVSSSGHLALLQNVFGDVNVSFDIVLHFATLLAVIVYFFEDIVQLITGFFSFSWKNDNFRICVYLIIGTIPAAFLGFIFRKIITASFSSLFVLGIGFFISGMFLLSASFYNSRKESEMSVGKTVLIGFSQALSILPGISRSGSTSSTGVLLGIPRDKAIRFSFLLSIPIIIGASLVNFSSLAGLDFTNSVFGFVFAFMAGLFSIFLFLNKVNLKNFRWFAFYCFFMGILSLVLYFL